MKILRNFRKEINMATETIRNVKINKRDKYDTFTQVDTAALGIAAGKLKLVDKETIRIRRECY